MRTAAERAVLAAPGVIAVDNQIVLLTDVPPPGPDSGPVMVDEVPDTETADVASETSDDGAGGDSSDATDGGAMAAGAPANPIPESVEIILQNDPEVADSKRAEVVGLVLSPKLDSERTNPGQ